MRGSLSGWELGRIGVGFGGGSVEADVRQDLKPLCHPGRREAKSRDPVKLRQLGPG